MTDAVQKANPWGADQQTQFPLITRSGLDQHRKPVHDCFNYSAQPGTVRYPQGAGRAKNRWLAPPCAPARTCSWLLGG